MSWPAHGDAAKRTEAREEMSEVGMMGGSKGVRSMVKSIDARVGIMAGFKAAPVPSEEGPGPAKNHQGGGGLCLNKRQRTLAGYFPANEGTSEKGGHRRQDSGSEGR